MTLTTVVRTTAVALLGSLAFLASPPHAALAHSELVSSSPSDGAELRKAPKEVVLTFGEEVLSQGSGIVVNGPDGQRYDIAASLTVGGTKASIDLEPASTDGRYDVSYRVVSVDGHVVSGSTTYSLVGVKPTKSTASTPTPTGGSDTLNSTLTVTEDESEDSGTSVVCVLGLGAIGLVLLVAIVAFFARGRRE